MILSMIYYTVNYSHFYIQKLGFIRISGSYMRFLF